MAGVKVEVKEFNKDDVDLSIGFATIMETLTRMGIINRQEKIITPTAYIYFDGKDYFIYHFKELLSMFDKIPKTLDEKDTDRRNAICTLLENWGLIEIIDTNVYQDELKEKINILLHKEKHEYVVNHKFNSFNKIAELRNMTC